MVIIITKYAAYDSYARLGLVKNNSERIICKITSNALFLLNFNFCCHWSIVSSAQSSAWLNEVSINHRLVIIMMCGMQVVNITEPESESSLGFPYDLHHFPPPPPCCQKSHSSLFPMPSPHHCLLDLPLAFPTCCDGVAMPCRSTALPAGIRPVNSVWWWVQHKCARTYVCIS